MNDSPSSITFTDTNVYGGIYFYTYAVICIAIIIGGFYFSSKYKLYYESYQLLHDIEIEFGIATLGIEALEIKYNINNKGDQKRKKEKVANIQIKHVRYELKKRFANIREMINNHEIQLSKKIDKIEEIKNEQQDNDPLPTQNNTKNDNETQLALELQLNHEMETGMIPDEVKVC